MNTDHRSEQASIGEAHASATFLRPRPFRILPARIGRGTGTGRRCRPAAPTFLEMSTLSAMASTSRCRNWPSRTVNPDNRSGRRRQIQDTPRGQHDCKAICRHGLSLLLETSRGRGLQLSLVNCLTQLDDMRSLSKSGWHRCGSFLPIKHTACAQTAALTCAFRNPVAKLDRALIHRPSCGPVAGLSCVNPHANRRCPVPAAVGCGHVHAARAEILQRSTITELWRSLHPIDGLPTNGRAQFACVCRRHFITYWQYRSNSFCWRRRE